MAACGIDGILVEDRGVWNDATCRSDPATGGLGIRVIVKFRIRN